jgi:hypothetical protein
MSEQQPAWGSAPQERSYPPERGAPVPVVEVRRGGPLDPAVIARRATTALVVHVVLIFFASVLSIPGAVFAGLALGEKHDPERARRLLRWSWGFLAAAVLFYVLLVITVILLTVFIFLAATN